MAVNNVGNNTEADNRLPICVFSAGGNFEKISAEDLLNKLCGVDEDLKKLKVAVVSVAGRFRQGKSFLLNYMLRYLQSGQNFNWLEDSTRQLKGFDWKWSSKSITQGVLIWPEVFRVRLPAADDIAVVLMDTQGVFDPETLPELNVPIFSLSVLLSSVQIFNLSKCLHVDDYAHFQTFVDYGRRLSSAPVMARDEIPGDVSSGAPFQELIFVIRDWQFAEEHPYGWKGGASYLREQLDRTDLPEKLLQPRQSIRNAFRSRRCFPLPYPGPKVASAKAYDGSTREMAADFKQHLRTLVEDVLSPKRLVIKRISGIDLTLSSFCGFVQAYVDALSAGGIPSPLTLCDATLSAWTAAILAESSSIYDANMKEWIKPGGITEEKFACAHDDAKDTAVAHLRNVVKTPDLSKQLADTLVQELDRVYAQILAPDNAQRFEQRYRAGQRVLAGTGHALNTVAIGASLLSTFVPIPHVRLISGGLAAGCCALSTAINVASRHKIPGTLSTRGATDTPGPHGPGTPNSPDVAGSPNTVGGGGSGKNTTGLATPKADAK